MSLVGKHWSRMRGRSKGRGNSGGSIDCAARSWPGILPSRWCHGTDRWTRDYMLQVLHGKSETSFFPDPAGTRELEYPRRYALCARDFFCVSHSNHVAHRVGFCLPSLPWSMYNTNHHQSLLPAPFRRFPCWRTIYCLSMLGVTFKNGLIMNSLRFI